MFRIKLFFAGMALALAGSIATASPAIQEPTLEDLLTLAGTYVTNFRDQLSGVVSEERYEQRARTPHQGVTRGFPQYEDEDIVLRSDFLLVRSPGAEQHVEFRDVFEVNGRLIRDRDERLRRLFLNPNQAAMAQVRRITAESARFNIGLIQRTLNTPTLALLFLGPSYQPRFSFRLVSDDKPILELSELDGLSSSDVSILEYKETVRPTLIQGKDDGDLPSYGRFWIDPEDGNILASELVLEGADVEAVVTVGYRHEPEVELLVPVEMRERYSDLYGSRVEGNARYSNFRRFQVQVNEGMQDRSEVSPKTERD